MLSFILKMSDVLQKKYWELAANLFYVWNLFVIIQWIDNADDSNEEKADDASDDQSGETAETAKADDDKVKTKSESDDSNSMILRVCNWFRWIF